MKHLLLLPLLLWASVSGATEPADTLPCRQGFIHSFSGDVRGAYVFNSSGVKNFGLLEGASIRHSSLSAHAQYSFSYPANSFKGRLYPGAYQGIGLSVTTFFDNSAIGTPVGVYLFQGAPVKRFSSRFSIDYEWNFGVSAGWHRTRTYSDINSNLVMGSRCNAILNLGFMARYRLSGDLSLRAGVEGTHYSNGNTSLPNPGINSLGLRVGFVYTPGGESPAPSLDAADAAEIASYGKGFSYDLLLYGSLRKTFLTDDGDKIPVAGHFGVAGVSFAPMYGVNRYFRCGLSVDVQYDESSNLKEYIVENSPYDDPKFYRQPFKECMMGGLSARAELVMPIFSINLGVGRNLVAVKANRHFYQTLNLKTSIYAGLWLNVGYRLHNFKSPDNLVLGLGYTFK